MFFNEDQEFEPMTATSEEFLRALMERDEKIFILQAENKAMVTNMEELNRALREAVEHNRNLVLTANGLRLDLAHAQRRAADLERRVTG